MTSRSVPGFTAIRGVAIFVAVGMVLTATSCSSTAPSKYTDLASAAKLSSADDKEHPFKFVDAKYHPGAISGVIMEPVAVYSGKDAQFGSVSEEDKKIVADYMAEKFPKTLSQKLRLANEPAATVARVRLTLTGVETSTPVLSTLSHITPLGLVLNGGLEASGGHGTALGSVTYAVEVFDSMSGELLYAYVTKQAPDALDVSASFGYLDACKTGVRIGASQLLNELTKSSL